MEVRLEMIYGAAVFSGLEGIEISLIKKVIMYLGK